MDERRGTPDRRKPAGGRLVVVLYARADSAAVFPVVDELNKRGIETWSDRDLKPGENWLETIAEVLAQAGAIVMFVSPGTFAGGKMSPEYEAAMRAKAPLLPVLIAGGNTSALEGRAGELGTRLFLDFSHYPASVGAPQVAEAADVALRLSDALNETFAARGVTKFEGFDRRGLARDLAAQSRGLKRRATDVEEEKKAPTSLFVVHGHDDEFLSDVTAFIRKLKVEPIVMRDVGGASLSLVQKFLEMGRSAKYAVVLLSADDYGAGRFQFEEQGVGDRALQFRARQNVILELGFFYGFLGWENVFVLEKGAPKVFPNFERPSDLNGVVFDRYDATGKWQGELHRRLSSHGFQIPALEALAS
jgi:predicted nucleotide-binding protein